MQRVLISSSATTTTTFSEKKAKMLMVFGPLHHVDREVPREKVQLVVQSVLEAVRDDQVGYLMLEESEIYTVIVAAKPAGSSEAFVEGMRESGIYEGVKKGWKRLSERYLSGALGAEQSRYLRHEYAFSIAFLDALIREGRDIVNIKALTRYLYRAHRVFDTAPTGKTLRIIKEQLVYLSNVSMGIEDLRNALQRHPKSTEFRISDHAKCLVAIQKCNHSDTKSIHQLAGIAFLVAIKTTGAFGKKYLSDNKKIPEDLIEVGRPLTRAMIEDVLNQYDKSRSQGYLGL